MLKAGVIAVVVLAMVAWARPAAAMQDGALISELVEYQEIRSAVPADTAARFARVMDADEDQRAAATALVDGARTEIGRIVNRHLRAVRDDATLEQMRRSEVDVVVQVAEVERRLLTDLRGLLREEQAYEFVAFERAHRRTLLKQAKPQPMPLDLWEFFASNGFDGASNESVRELLATFDRESDVALVRQRRALKAYYENVRLGLDGTEEARLRDRAAQNELLASNRNIERVYASVVEPMLDALPPALGDTFAMRVVGVAIGEYDRNLSEPDRYPVVREVLRLELTDDQRREFQGVIDAAKGEALTLARWCVLEQARFVLLDDELRTDGRTSPINLYLEKASTLRRGVSSQLIAMLTPDQRLAYDASDVVDPSTSSIVKDE